MRFKFLEHTADIKFQAFGTSKEKAFANSAYALKEAIAGKVKIRGKIKKKFSVKGKDDSSLLYNFLEEILFLLDSSRFILSSVKSIKISENKLNAEISGDRASSYRFSNDVKAVTYNQMFVKKQSTGWIVQVVLDA